MNEWIPFPLLCRGIQAHLYPAVQSLMDASTRGSFSRPLLQLVHLITRSPGFAARGAEKPSVGQAPAWGSHLPGLHTSPHSASCPQPQQVAASLPGPQTWRACSENWDHRAPRAKPTGPLPVHLTLLCPLVSRSSEPLCGRHWLSPRAPGSPWQGSRMRELHVGVPPSGPSLPSSRAKPWASRPPPKVKSTYLQAPNCKDVTARGVF